MADVVHDKDYEKDCEQRDPEAELTKYLVNYNFPR
jgi:hypothetical protein